jgi:hypothetical protein
MPRGDKGAYSTKQKRQAEHIEEGYERKGTSKKEAERRALGDGEQQSGGGRNPVPGRKRAASKRARRRRRPARKRAEHCCACAACDRAAMPRASSDRPSRQPSFGTALAAADHGPATPQTSGGRLACCPA